MDKLPLTSKDILAEKVARIREEFQEVFLEEKIDFERLKMALGEFVDNNRERYGLTWAGKSEAIRNIQTPSTGTLIPVPEESVNFETSENLIIEGENLEVLKLLQKSYHGKIKMIYIDPPYNTGNEFIYPDNFREGLEDYLRYSGQVDGDGMKLSTNTEADGRFHSKWLNMMYPRLFLARNLLSDDGVIFVSIDNHEVKNLAFLLDEIFGEENRISMLTWEKGRKNDSTFYSDSVEYVLIYAKNKEFLARKGAWRAKKPGLDKVLNHYNELRRRNLSHEQIEQEMRNFYRSLPDDDPAKGLKHFFRSDDRGLFFGGDISSASTSIPDYDVLHPVTGKPVRKPSRGWGCTQPVMQRLIHENRILFGPDESTIPLKKIYLEEADTVVATPVIYKDGRAATLTLKQLFGDTVFNNPKDHEVIRDFIEYIGAKDGIILDFFAGSGTTAHAVLDLNHRDGGTRKFILVQLPEPTGRSDYPTISALCIERVRRVIEQLNKKQPLELNQHEDRGFKVFRLSNSNFKQWDPSKVYSERELAQQLKLFADNILPGRRPRDILYEIVLKSGFPLTSSIDTFEVSSQTVFSIAGGTLLICLEDKIFEETLKGMIELGPQNIVCLDTAFHGNDNLKTNVKLLMESHGIEFHTV